MGYEYEVAFVYDTTIIYKIVWTDIQDEDEVVNIALREIESETGLVITGSEHQVRLTATIG